MYPALIKRIFPVCLAFSSLLILYSLFLVNSAFASTLDNCNPSNGQHFDPGDPINFGGDVNYTESASYTVDFSVTITGPESRSTGTVYSYTFPANFGSTGCVNIYSDLFYTPGTYSWHITASVGGSSILSSASTSFIIDSILPPPPDLDNNITFSNLFPTSGTYDNPVIFDGVITDNEPTPGVRTVEINIDGAPAWTTTYASGGVSGPISLNIASPPTTHNWYIEVRLGSSSTRYPRFTTYTINVNPPSSTPNAPTSLVVNCPDSGSGFKDGSGLIWCNENSPYEYGGYYNTIDGGQAIINVRDPRGNIFTTISPSGPSTNRGETVSSTPWYILLEGAYTWETWSSGTGWESTHATGNFGVDTTDPSGPGTPYLTKEGSNWIVRWISNGTDAPSGIHEARLMISDNGSPCSWVTYGPTETEGGFTCFDPGTGGNTTSPLPGHTYTFGVTTCDFAGNCIPGTPGDYDGSLTPTYMISGNVFEDINGNGTKDWLTDTDYQGASIWFNGGPGTTTDWSGNYSFTDLPAGTYTIELITPVGYILTTPPAFRTLVITSDSPNNNFGIQNNGAPTPTPTPVPASSPTLQSLKVNLSDAGQVAQVNGITFSGMYGISGNQTGSDSGVKWLNPINITLNARRGNLNLPIHRYYVAFYDKTVGAKLTNKATFITDIKKKLNPNATPPGNPKNGFLLAYGIESKITGAGSTTAYHYYIWNKTGWEKITTSSYAVKDALNNTLFTATKIANGFLSPNYYVTWKIDFDKNFGSKPMYTAAFVGDQAYVEGQLTFSDFNAGIVPNP